MLINLCGNWINPSNIVNIKTKTSYEVHLTNGEIISIPVNKTNQQNIDCLADYINLLEVQASSKIFNNNKVAPLVEAKKWGIWISKHKGWITSRGGKAFIFNTKTKANTWIKKYRWDDDYKAKEYKESE